jgi:hypothetical protein
VCVCCVELGRKLVVGQADRPGCGTLIPSVKV